MFGTILMHMIFSFISSVTFGVLCNVPRRSLIAGGIIGTIGWMGYWGLSSNGVGVFLSSLCCSLLLAYAGQIAAHLFKQPLTIFFVPGLVPVVPGITFYEGFKKLLLNEYEQSFYVFLNVVYCAVGITCGLVIASIIFRFTTAPLFRLRN